MRLSCPLLVAALSSALLSCGPRRIVDIGPPLIAPAEFSRPIGYECLLASPVIFVGRIARVEKVGLPAPAAEGGPRLVPVEMEVFVELTVQGTFADGRAALVYAYAFAEGGAPPAGAALPPFDPAPGERRLFFVRKVGALNRLARDGYDYALPVRSGRHLALPLALERGTPERIARILLTPTPQVDSRSFAAGLERSAAAARAFCGLDLLVPMLDTLTKHPDAGVATAARFLHGEYSLALQGAGPLASPPPSAPCPALNP